MSGNCSNRSAQIDGGSIRCRRACGTVTTLFALWVLTRGAAVRADERFSIPLEHPKSGLDAPYDRPAYVPATFTLPATYQLQGAPELRSFPADDFRPRGHSVFDDKPQVDPAESVPMLRESTVWQRLRDFRSHGRVRLLTLWETGGSAVSLQAGKKGEPSLQWTSRSLNRGGATRGLFDQLFSVSLVNASRNLHFAPRAAGPEVAAGASKLPDGGARK
jgi:hypothetical protein